MVGASMSGSCSGTSVMIGMFGGAVGPDGAGGVVGSSGGGGENGSGDGSVGMESRYPFRSLGNPLAASEAATCFVAAPGPV